MTPSPIHYNYIAYDREDTYMMNRRYNPSNSPYLPQYIAVDQELTDKLNNGQFKYVPSDILPDIKSFHCPFECSKGFTTHNYLIGHINRCHKQRFINIFWSLFHPSREKTVGHVIKLSPFSSTELSSPQETPKLIIEDKVPNGFFDKPSG